MSNVEALETSGIWTLVFTASCFMTVLLLAAMVRVEECWWRVSGHDQEHRMWWHRRVSLGGMSLALCWSAVYAIEHGWQAWPPLTVALLFFDYSVIIRIVSKASDLKHHLGRKRLLIPDRLW